MRPCLVWLLAAAPPPTKDARPAMIEDARTIVAAVVVAARDNQKEAKPRSGDELTELYLRHAALAAGKLPQKRQGRALALAVGVALDTSATLRNNFLTAKVWKSVETDDERVARLKVLGTPTLHKRHDLTQHFAVSAALTAVSGSKAAEAAGILKEVLDSEPGGSGFSFADLAADLSGIALAEQLIETPNRLAALERTFKTTDFCLAPAGLPEGLNKADFEKRYGGPGDERFQRELTVLKKNVAGLPGFRKQPNADNKPQTTNNQ